MDASAATARVEFTELERALSRIAELEAALEASTRAVERSRGAELLERRRLEAAHRRSEERVRSLQEQLRRAQKMEAIGQLTAGIAHDFNNLLAAIIPSIQLARRDASGSARDRLHDAEYAASRAAELVRQLMVFARHEAANRTRGSVDVRELVQRTVSMCRATFARSLDIGLFASSTLPAVAGDAGQLEQVFLNVCLNARDALESSGKGEHTIRIELDATTGEEHSSGCRDFIRVRISDNGSGMSADVCAHVFEPFFTTKEVGRGTGLGLATAYAIVVDHGGKLFCESTPGDGTTFTVLLPVSSEVVAERHAAP